MQPAIQWIRRTLRSQTNDGMLIGTVVIRELIGFTGFKLGYTLQIPEL